MLVMTTEYLNPHLRNRYSLPGSAEPVLPDAGEEEGRRFKSFWGMIVHACHA